MKKSARILPNQRLKQARLQQGWSQEYVAREVGTDAFTVSRWERGIAMPSPHFRLQLGVLFKQSALELGLVPQEAEEQTVPAFSPPDPALLIQPSLLDPALPPPPLSRPGSCVSLRIRHIPMHRGISA